MCALVLVAEDDPKQVELMSLYLRNDGHSVVAVDNGNAALEQIRAIRPELVVLDVMMPGLDGLEVVRTVRRDHDMPVLMVTARSTAEDKLAGFELGADDYLTKPYDPRELMARVRSLLRRAQSGGAKLAGPLQIGALVLDQVRHEVLLDGKRVECTRAEFVMLQAMMAAPGRVFSRRQLLEYAHGDGNFVTERSVDSHLSNLRRKIEADPHRQRYLHTVYGVGYKVSGDG